MTMGARDEKVVLVTGSSRGIAAATAKLFAEYGARVVVHGRDETALADVRAEIIRAGGKAMQAVADVTKFTELEMMRHRIEQEFGPIDILVARSDGAQRDYAGTLVDTRSLTARRNTYGA